ncbi:MAG: anti-sigma factor domain-containing protein [Paracoccaceae bacterium]
MSLDRLSPDEIANDYVFGLLEPEDMAEVERRLDADTELATLVASLQDRVLELDLTAPSAEPGPDLLARIDAEIDRAATPTPAAPTGRPARRTDPRTDPRPAEPRTGPRRTGRRAFGPLGLLGAAAAALLLVAVGALGGRALFTVEPAVIAVLLNDAGEPFALIEGQEDNTTRVSVLADAQVPETRVLQLWTKPDPDGPPVSLGIFERPTSITLRREDLPPPSRDQLYEITLEQEGGSPTGLPTGPILGVGTAEIPR